MDDWGGEEGSKLAARTLRPVGGEKPVWRGAFVNQLKLSRALFEPGDDSLGRGAHSMSVDEIQNRGRFMSSPPSPATTILSSPQLLALSAPMHAAPWRSKVSSRTPVRVWLGAERGLGPYPSRSPRT